ncbi:MAG: polysaccharide biosynthesis tyrosine autokinase [Alistipes sp.]
MIDQTTNHNLNIDEPDATGNLTIHDIIQMVLLNWYWFALSVAICIGAAYFYLAQTPEVFSRTATILVKDDRKGGSTDIEAFSDLAGFQNRRSVDNEVFILQSRRLMMETVKRLQLTVGYTTNDHLRTRDLYGQSPVEVDFIDDNAGQSLSLELTPLDDNQIQLTDFSDKFIGDDEDGSVITAQYGDTIATPIGQIVVRKTPYMNRTYFKTAIGVVKNSLSAATTNHRAAVKIDVANKQASIVNITMNSTEPKRAEDVINTLVAVYNEDAIDDKRRISVATSDFIKARLEVIGSDLKEVDSDIEGLKKDNQMIDFNSDATRNVTESSRYKADGLTIDNQINVAEFILTYLNTPSNAGELIPMVASVTNSAIADQISEYNTAILRREKLRENSSETNPVIQELDNVLASVRRSIIASLNSHISALEIQRTSLRKEELQTNSRILNMPSQEKEILGIMRQQKIKEELFLYLLNKQEETQLNYAVAESSARIIDTAYGSNVPVSPKRMIILGIAAMTGLAVPFLLLYLIGMLNTTIRGRKDVEDVINAPFLGNIPNYEDPISQGIVVRETGRDALSEAFRMLRSNMSFMNVSSNKEIKCILFTSSEPHEGKTFVGMNLGATVAMAGKRVIFIDLDLRRHAFSTLTGHGNSHTGISSYLSGAINSIDELISHTDIHKNFDAIYAGIQPPNPTEMLLSERLEQLIITLRERYDYIFLDSTPAMSVADAIITDRLADLCIYVVREGVLDRRQLPDIERLYREKKLHNMCIALNGTHDRLHGYGYRYGYGYGYGYGYKYGYGYGDDYKEISYRKRIMGLFRHRTHKVKK